MNEQIIIEQLIRFGLNEAEVQIYLHLLKNGPKTPLEVSRETNLNRTKIYRLIDLLRQNKLIEQFGSERGIKLRASPASNLELLLVAQEENVKRNKESLLSVIASLAQMPSKVNEQFEVIHYQGIEGLKQMLWNELKAKEILIFGHENINQFVGKDFAEKIRQQEVDRNIKLKEIGNSIEYKSPDQSFYTNAVGWKKTYEYRQIPDASLQIRDSVQIYNDTVSIINWKSGKVGVEIINKPFADMQRQIFWQFWKLAQ